MMRKQLLRESTICCLSKFYFIIGRNTKIQREALSVENTSFCLLGNKDISIEGNQIFL